MTRFNSFFDQVRRIGVRNTSGEDCPPFGLLAVTGSEQRGDSSGKKRTVLLGTKPSTTFYREHVVNGPQKLRAGKTGKCYIGGPLWIAFDDADGTPAAGEGWGPKPGQWDAALGYPGITVEGVKSAENTLLVGRLSLIDTLLCKATASLSTGPVSSNYKIWSGTIASGADSGFTTLPSIEIQSDKETDDYFVAHWTNNGWVSPAGGGGTGGGTTLYKCLLNGSLSAASGTASIDNVTAFDGSTPPTPTSASNPLGLAGLNNDIAVIVEDTSSGSPSYYILNIQHHSC